MILSRSRQRKVNVISTYMKLCQGLSWAILGGGLALAWHYGNKLGFTISCIIVFFGVLLVNPDNIRCCLPGINSSFVWVRVIAAFIYLIAAIAGIGMAGEYR
ncbi:MAG: hypothetical protein H6Q74_321 [Firmicutes bacterium]|nr:hypothetical protein [Bacillota bacterium]